MLAPPLHSRRSLQSTVAKLLGARGIRSAFETTGIIIVLFTLSWPLAVALLVSAPLLTPLIAQLGRRIGLASKASQVGGGGGVAAWRCRVVVERLPGDAGGGRSRCGGDGRDRFIGQTNACLLALLSAWSHTPVGTALLLLAYTATAGMIQLVECLLIQRTTHATTCHPPMPPLPPTHPAGCRQRCVLGCQRDCGEHAGGEAVCAAAARAHALPWAAGGSAPSVAQGGRQPGGWGTVQLVVGTHRLCPL